MTLLHREKESYKAQYTQALLTYLCVEPKTGSHCTVSVFGLNNKPSLSNPIKVRHPAHIQGKKLVDFYARITPLWSVEHYIQQRFYPAEPSAACRGKVRSKHGGQHLRARWIFFLLVGQEPTPGNGTNQAWAQRRGRFIWNGLESGDTRALTPSLTLNVRLLFFI